MNKHIAVAVVAGAMAAAGDACAQTAVQWRVEDGGNGHWYLKDSTLRTWSAGRQFAEGEGGHLATFDSLEEQGVALLLTLNGNNSVWIGLIQSPRGTEPGEGWMWVTGEPLSFFDWANDGVTNPNDGYSTGEDVGEWTPSWGSGWNDMPDAEEITRPSLIEWSADCNQDGIVDYGQCLDGTMWDGNTNNIPDCCEQGLPCTVLGRAVQWRVEDGGNGHWYQGTALPSGGYTRAAALAAARSRHGDLVSFGSAAERDFVALNALNHPRMWVRDGGTTYGPWTGAFMDATCTWTWSDGTVFGYAPWASGEPDSGCGWSGDNYACLICKSCGPVAALPSQLGDLGVGNALAPGLLIEWSADCNNDGIVDYGQIMSGDFPDLNSNGVPDTCECAGADITANGTVDGADLGALLAFWGPVGPVLPEADLNRDGVVNGEDLGTLLANWGPCGG